MSVQSSPTIPPISGLTKKRGIRKSAVFEVIYYLQNPNLGLGNGRRYWGGGGFGRGSIWEGRYWGEAVLGGAVFGGTTVL